MEFHARKLLTIVTEAAVEHRLTEEIERLGAPGYTVTDARGKGDRGIRDAHSEMAANVRIETIVDESVVDSIIVHLKEHYFANYAIICFVSDVEVLRPAKF